LWWFITNGPKVLFSLSQNTVTQDLSAAQRYKESILGTAQFDAKMKHMKEHPEQYETKIAHPKHLSHKKFRGDDKSN